MVKLDIYLAIAAIAINFMFVVLVLLRTSLRGVYVIFLGICVSVILWNFCELMAGLSGARPWPFISAAVSALIPVISFHFILILVRPQRKYQAWVTYAYGLSIMLALASLFALMFEDGERFIDSYWWDILYFAFVASFYTFGLVMLFLAVRRSRKPNERSLLGYILIAGIAGFITVFTDHTQSMGMPVAPLGHWGSMIFPSILAIGVFKHRLEIDVLAQMRMKLGMLSEMSSTIIHEIKNPLTSIKGAARLLRRNLREKPGANSLEYVDLLCEEADRLEKILVNFQSYSRPLKLDMTRIDVNELITKTVKLVEAEPSRVKIHLALEEGLPLLSADASLLKQVFINLIRNAQEASCDRLEIRTEKGPSEIHVIFSDNGSGLPPHSLERMCEPFFTTKPAGGGMGLAICKRIMEAHGGKIGARNLVPHGAEFMVSVPL